MTTKIEWTEESINPITGCTKISPGCAHCYAERMALRLKSMGRPQYQAVVGNHGWTGRLAFHPDSLKSVLARKKPTTYFVCSMSDIGHEHVPDHWLTTIWTAMAAVPHHTFQILTKRPRRLLDFLAGHSPLPNVWIGTTTENQQTAADRLPLLLQIPAVVRFVSCEPLLGPLDLRQWLKPEIVPGPMHEPNPGTINGQSLPAARLRLALDWVIVGGESGPRARPMHPAWVRQIRDHCLAASVPFFFKQWGQYVPEKQLCGGDYGTNGLQPFNSQLWVWNVGKHKSGRLLDGLEWNQYPTIDKPEGD